ncbi:hypothetical protein TOC8171_25290 [Pseudomonas syringae]
MHLRYAAPFGVQGRQAYRPRGHIATDGPDACVQRCTVQRFALTQLHCPMQKTAKLAIEFIMNFKFRLMIHDPCL